jgi:hypothetical protein
MFHLLFSPGKSRHVAQHAIVSGDWYLPQDWEMQCCIALKLASLGKSSASAEAEAEAEAEAVARPRIAAAVTCPSFMFEVSERPA